MGVRGAGCSVDQDPRVGLYLSNPMGLVLFHCSASPEPDTHISKDTVLQILIGVNMCIFWLGHVTYVT